jgi:hypothetical protein
MTIPRTNGRTIAPVRVLEIPPGDDWLDPNSLEGTVSVFPRVLAADLVRPVTERTDVFYFDLPRFAPRGNVVEPAVKWADRYHEYFPSDTVPATLVAIGKEVPIEGRRLLEKAVVYYLDERRRSLQRMMGVGDRGHQIYRLIQNLSGYPIAPTDFPFGMATSVSPSVQPSPQTAPSSNWDAYTQRPQHVDPAEVGTLFKWLTRKPGDWERDL